jgi:2-amino-4-hydroxy-6-hydroxymethyldihydropteridine diphosphokinase
MSQAPALGQWCAVMMKLARNATMNASPAVSPIAVSTGFCSLARAPLGHWLLQRLQGVWLESVLACTDCVIGVGANLGKRDCTFAWTLEELGKIGQIIGISNVYENPAVGGPPQPDYLNAAVRLQAGLSPLGILEAVQRIERLAGRERDVHWGPRTLDLDLLWIPDRALDTPLLQLPHPHLKERAFALLPLTEVAVTATDPRTRVRYATLLASHRTQDLRLHSVALGPPWRWQPVRTRPRSVPSTLAASLVRIFNSRHP